jgi:hypothetical protein
MIYDIIDRFKDYYSSTDRAKDTPMTHAEYCRKIVDMLDVVEKAITKEEFSLQATLVSGKKIDEEETGFYLKDSDYFYIIQPMTQLSASELDELHGVISELSKKGIIPDDKPFLIIPYDVRLLKAKIVASK